MEMHKVDKFLQWMEVNGVQLRGCKIRPCNSEERFGIYSANNDCGGVLLVAPLRLAITPMTILQDPSLGSEYGKLFEGGDVDDRFLIILFLLVERARQVSFWSPYLNMLPSTFGTPLWFTEDEFSELKGTALYHAAKLQLKNLKALFDDKVKQLVESFLLLIGVPFREILFEEFLWANSIFWTRALNIPCSRSFVFPSQPPVQDGHDCKLHGNHAQVLESTEDICSSGCCHLSSSGGFTENIPIAEQSTTVWVEGLVPGIDFCNHDPNAKALWEIDDENGSITGVPFSMYLITGPNVTFRAEEEIRISYGSKGNEELLYLYGFVIENNPDDYLMVHYPKEALQQIDCDETKSLLLKEQNLQLRWLLPASLMWKGNSNESSPALDGCKKDSSQVLGYSWSGHRKLPSYMDHFVFPEDLMAALRTIAMNKEDMHGVMSMLKELISRLYRGGQCYYIFLFSASVTLKISFHQVMACFTIQWVNYLFFIPVSYLNLDVRGNLLKKISKQQYGRFVEMLGPCNCWLIFLVPRLWSLKRVLELKSMTQSFLMNILRLYYFQRNSMLDSVITNIKGLRGKAQYERTDGRL